MFHRKNEKLISEAPSHRGPVSECERGLNTRIHFSVCNNNRTKSIRKQMPSIYKHTHTPPMYSYQCLSQYGSSYLTWLVCSTPNNHSRFLLFFFSFSFAERRRQGWSRHERSTSMAKRIYRKRRCCFHSRWRHSNKSSGSNSKLCKYKIKWNRIKIRKRNENVRWTVAAAATKTTATTETATALEQDTHNSQYTFFYIYYVFSFVWHRERWTTHTHTYRTRFNIRFASTGNYLCVHPYGRCTDCKQNYEWHRIYRF